MLSKKQRTALLVGVHQEIERVADALAQEIAGEANLGELAYPPNGGLSAEEEMALKSVPKTADMVSALRKVIASASAECFFSFFCLLDGVRDPENDEVDWPGFQISSNKDEPEEDQFLHDGFFGSYWIWRYRR